METPVDHLTGIPLPFKPEDEVLELLNRPRFNGAIRRAIELTNANRRKEAEGTLSAEEAQDERSIEAAKLAKRDFVNLHHVHHPDSVPELEDEAGRAVRESRGQYIMQPRHVMYHRYFDGPPLPQTDGERFKTLLFCAANYIPRDALDFSTGAPQKVSLSDKEISRLQTQGEVRMVRPHYVRQFLQQYVMANLSNVQLPQKLENEFLELGRDGAPDNAYDRSRHQELAYQLLTHVIRPTTEPLQAVYKESRKEGLWLPHPHINPQYVVEKQLLGDKKLERRANIRRIGGTIFSALLQEREGVLTAA